MSDGLTLSIRTRRQHPDGSKRLLLHAVLLNTQCGTGLFDAEDERHSAALPTPVLYTHKHASSGCLACLLGLCSLHDALMLLQGCSTASK